MLEHLIRVQILAHRFFKICYNIPPVSYAVD